MAVFNPSRHVFLAKKSETAQYKKKKKKHDMVLSLHTTLNLSTVFSARRPRSLGAPWASPAPDRVAPGTQHRRPAERQGTKSSCPATWRGGQGAAGLQAGLWERTWTRLGHTLDIAKETQEILDTLV